MNALRRGVLCILFQIKSVLSDTALELAMLTVYLSSLGRSSASLYYSWEWEQWPTSHVTPLQTLGREILAFGLIDVPSQHRFSGLWAWEIWGGGPSGPNN